MPLAFVELSIYMAMITCPECKKDISEAAASCPHCGYPLAKRREQEWKPADDTAVRERRKRPAQAKAADTACSEGRSSVRNAYGADGCGLIDLLPGLRRLPKPARLVLAMMAGIVAAVVVSRLWV